MVRYWYLVCVNKMPWTAGLPGSFRLKTVRCWWPLDVEAVDIIVHVVPSFGSCSRQSREYQAGIIREGGWGLQISEGDIGQAFQYLLGLPEQLRQRTGLFLVVLHAVEQNEHKYFVKFQSKTLVIFCIEIQFLTKIDHFLPQTPEINYIS